MYELLALEKAFGGSNMNEIINAILNNKPKQIHGVKYKMQFIMDKYK